MTNEKLIYTARFYIDEDGTYSGTLHEHDLDNKESETELYEIRNQSTLNKIISILPIWIN